ncbi:hypothetical protein RDI58_024714 [Solanum bulbocastanum]|uniref:Uncharacterized protein n=1 Tax=Solanum bulbocastanum TaxID=147425 RepID=A0AAN8T6F3_SOLBU
MASSRSATTHPGGGRGTTWTGGGQKGEFYDFPRKLQVAYHNVNIEEPALGILISIPCNYCLKVCVNCEHFQGYDNLCSKCTTNFNVLLA